MEKIRSFQCGITMTEVLVSVAIVAIIMAIGIPGLSGWVKNTQVRSAAESVLTGLQLARGEAVHRNTAVSFTLNGTAWTVGCTTPSTVAPICEANIQSSPTAEGGDNVSLTITPTGKTSVDFNAFGQAVAGSITQIDVSIAGGATPLRILLNGGSARLCNPALPSANLQSCG